MDFFIDWLHYIWDLLQVTGWWILFGLALSAVMQAVLPQAVWKLRGIAAVSAAVIGGALLPMCNFGIVPLAFGIWQASGNMAAALAFFSAAVLLNPAALLLAIGYMGPVLTVAYGVAALAAAVLTGLLAMRFCPPGEGTGRRRLGDALRQSFLQDGPRLALWICIGILVQGGLMALFPASVYRAVLLDPTGASVIEAVVMGVLRHVCIPDDLSLMASLVASGLAPGSALLFLLAGVVTNLPDLLALGGMAGKKAAALFAGSAVLCSTAVWGVLRLWVEPGFLPRFNLAGTEIYTLWANRLSIGTWMPARLPCALLLLAMGLYGFQRSNKF